MLDESYAFRLLHAFKRLDFKVLKQAAEIAVIVSHTTPLTSTFETGKVQHKY